MYVVYICIGWIMCVCGWYVLCGYMHYIYTYMRVYVHVLGVCWSCFVYMMCDCVCCVACVYDGHIVGMGALHAWCLCDM